MSYAPYMYASTHPRPQDAWRLARVESLCRRRPRLGLRYELARARIMISLERPKRAFTSGCIQYSPLALYTYTNVGTW